jgi:hypothetical protein
MKSFSCFFSVSTFTILGISNLDVFAWNKNVKVEIKTLLQQFNFAVQIHLFYMYTFFEVRYTSAN